MIKKYYSTNEYFYTDSDNQEKPYIGYVLIDNGIPYDFNTKLPLSLGTNYITNVNLSTEQFDRILDFDLQLPKSSEDCSFAANDFLKSSVIDKIVKNLEINNTYLFKNCFISQNNLPIATKIPVLSPYRNFVKKDDEYDKLEYGPVSEWFWSNISYNNIQNIWNKENWPNTIEGYDWSTDDLIDSIILPTNKKYDSKLKDTSSRSKLFAVFLGFKSKIQLMNLYLCPSNIIEPGVDPLKILPDEEIDLEASKRFFKQYSQSNNQENNDGLVNNLNILSFNTIDPNNSQSIEFKNITSISISGNYLYVVDSGLNGLYKYDISKCLSDRGAATNKITLSDFAQGLGGLNKPYLFNNPLSISAFNDNLAILDKNNNAVKVLDSYFNSKFTIRSGAFVRQNSKIVNICPYDFILDKVSVKSGSIWVISEVSDKISIDIFSKDGEYIANNEVRDISLIIDTWINPETGQPSSNNPITSKEEIKKIDFSYNNSNYYYIITDRRIIKFQLSKLSYPIGITSYYYRSITINNLIWENVYQQWNSVQDMGNKLVTWDYNQDKELITYPQNKCFAITGVPDIDSDIIFNILDNRTYFNNGSLQRIDNYESNKLLFIDNLSKKPTYKLYDKLSKANLPLLAKVGENVPKYIEIDLEPSIVIGESIIIKPIEGINQRTYNAIIFYEEPNVLKSTLLKTNIDIFSNDELSFKDNKEYYNALSFNKNLHKILFNLQQIKKYIYGTFVAGHSVDSIMTYDHVEVDQTISELGNDIENFFIGDNEQTSIILNRCFMNLYNLQLNILKKMQTSYISSLNYNINTYKII